MNFRRFLNLRFMLRLMVYAIGYMALGPIFLRGLIQIFSKFMASSVSFDIDTLNLRSNTSFPAVTVCEVFNQEQLDLIRLQQFGNNSGWPSDELLLDVIYYRGLCPTCKRCETELCPEYLPIIALELKRSCVDIMYNCLFSDQLLDCCEYFRPIITEYGMCFAFNSIQAWKSVSSQQFINRDGSASRLLFNTLTDVEVFVHATNEVPFSLARDLITEQVPKGITKQILLQVMEVHNDDNVIHLPIEQRRCRFENELVFWPSGHNTFKFYSLNSCKIDCLIQLHLDHCNCTQHFLAGALPDNFNSWICNFKGLQCLNDNANKFKELVNDCKCLNSCHETDFDIVYNSADTVSDLSEDDGKIEIGILQLPTERYIRRVQRDYLNLLISLGGFLGFFFNISIIRLVEILYKTYLFIRRLRLKFVEILN